MMQLKIDMVLVLANTPVNKLILNIKAISRKVAKDMVTHKKKKKNLLLKVSVV